MKRLWFALAFAILVAGTVTLGITQINSHAQKAINLAEKAEKYANNEQKEKCLEACAELENYWNGCEKTLDRFVNHTEIYDIGRTISSLKTYVEFEEKSEFAAQINEVKCQLEHLKKAERFILK